MSRTGEKDAIVEGIEDGLPIKLLAAGGLQSLFLFKSLEESSKEGHLGYYIQLRIVGEVKR